MRQSALIRLGAIATYDVLASEPTRPHTELYRSASRLRILDGRLAPYVCVDHDKHPIGRVLSLLDLEDVGVSVNGDKTGKWLYAHVEIDKPPAWLKRGVAASISYAPTWTREVNGWRIIEQGLLREVSILSPGLRGAEPCATVRTVGPVDRRMPDGSIERDLPNGAVEILHPGGRTISRRNLGQVLGVR